MKTWLLLGLTLGGTTCCTAKAPGPCVGLGCASGKGESRANGGSALSCRESIGALNATFSSTRGPNADPVLMWLHGVLRSREVGSSRDWAAFAHLKHRPEAVLALDVCLLRERARGGEELRGVPRGSTLFGVLLEYAQHDADEGACGALKFLSIVGGRADGEYGEAIQETVLELLLDKRHPIVRCWEERGNLLAPGGLGSTNACARIGDLETGYSACDRSDRLRCEAIVSYLRRECAKTSPPSPDREKSPKDAAK